MEHFVRLIVFAILVPLTIILTPIDLFVQFWNWGRQRTNTRHQQLFTLAHPHPVSVDFAPPSHSDIELTIPPYSRWYSNAISHDTTEACLRLETTDGHWYFTSRPGGTVTSGRGHTYQQDPQSFLSWGKASETWARMRPATVKLRMDKRLYHTICSAIQDADIFFSLASTPLWLRAIFYATYAIPYGVRMRETMIQDALWFQLRTIYAVNDCWTYEGSLPIYLYWDWPPDWAEDWRYEFQFVWSRFVVKAAALTGRVALGMKAEYLEYGWTPAEVEVGEL